MKIVAFFLGLIIMGGFLFNGAVEDEYESKKKGLYFLKEYRYKKTVSQISEEFLEYKILLRTGLKVYFDFTWPEI